MFKPEQPVTVESFGNPNAEQTVLLYAPHDAPFASFARVMPEYLRACQDPEAVRLVAESQRDVGTLRLAREITVLITSRRRDLKVILMASQMPRTVVDGNRLYHDRPGKEANAIWHSFDFDLHPGLYQELSVIHQTIIDTATGTHRSELKEGDFYLELHSMGPYTPPIHLRPEPGNLPSILKLWRHQVYPELRRSTDVLTEIHQSNGEVITFADEPLSHAIASQLSKQEIPFAFNRPYAGRDFLTGCQMGLEGQQRGIRSGFIDIVKTDLCETDPEHPEEFDLCSAVLDDEKVLLYAEMLTEAILGISSLTVRNS